MGANRLARAVRVLAATGAAAALVAASPGSAQAATQESTRYDGDATALRIEGLRLDLFPEGFGGAPAQVKPLIDALDQLRAQAPEQLQRESLSLVMPDQVIGQAQFPGTDTQGSLPENPLLTADFLEARSVKAANGDLVSEAGVGGLSLGGGVLSADLIKTSCVGDGETVALDVSELDLRSNQEIVDSRVSLEPGTAVPIAGLGTITFNQTETDGTTYAEGTNVVIDLDSDLSLDALLGLFDTTLPAARAALEQVLLDLGSTRFGPDGEQPLKQVFNEENLARFPSDRFEEGAATLADEVRSGARQFPKEVREALNNVAHLAGTVTVSNAACSQATVARSAPRPQAPQQAAPVQPAGDSSEPPLADTGSPVGMLGIALAGLVALAGGTYALTRLRRREA
jgi:hypothetical protein